MKDKISDYSILLRHSIASILRQYARENGVMPQLEKELRQLINQLEKK